MYYNHTPGMPSPYGTQPFTRQNNFGGMYRIGNGQPGQTQAGGLNRSGGRPMQPTPFQMPQMGGGYGFNPMMGGGYSFNPMMGGGYGFNPMMGGGYGFNPMMGGFGMPGGFGGFRGPQGFPQQQPYGNAPQQGITFMGQNSSQPMGGHTPWRSMLGPRAPDFGPFGLASVDYSRQDRTPDLDRYAKAMAGKVY